MTNKMYIITYNPGLNFNKTIFQNYIKSLSSKGYISDWSHYLDNSYLVVSNNDIVTIYNAVFPGIPRRFLLIIEVDPNNSQGWLPRQAWAWIKKYQK